MSEKKIAFIVPYFGKFSNYFEVWLLSCKYNPTIDWLVFTDDRTDYNYPENVKVFYTTFSQIQDLIQSKFEFQIVLDTPYQLCEFRIAFGEIFEDYLNDYHFWGYCDTDLIWGNLRRHLPDDILDSHSKISWRGHLTLFRNERRISRLYKSEIESIEFYKYLFSNKSQFPMASDEREINYIFNNAGEKIYKKLIFADLKIRSFNFQLLHFPDQENYKNKSQIFYWEAGELNRVYVVGNEIKRENFAYIHFLKRDMRVQENLDLQKRIVIIPNRIINSDQVLLKDEIIKKSKQRIYWSYYLSKISFSYVLKKYRYFKSKRIFRNEYYFLPLKSTEIQLPEPNSEIAIF